MIAGVDLSSHAVDVVLLNDDTNQATWHRFELAGTTAFERARSLRGVFPTRSWWEENGVWLLGIEDPHSRFPHVAKALGMATGAVAALLPRDLCVIATAPNEWKQVFTGQPTASKFDVKAAVDVRLLGDLTLTTDWPQDAYDAYAIAWAVRLLNNDAATAAEGATV